MWQLLSDLLGSTSAIVTQLRAYLFYGIVARRLSGNKGQSNENKF